MNTLDGYWLYVEDPFTLCYTAECAEQCANQTVDIGASDWRWMLIGSGLTSSVSLSTNAFVRETPGVTIPFCDADPGVPDAYHEGWIGLPICGYSTEDSGYCYVTATGGPNYTPFVDTLSPWEGYWIDIEQPGLTLMLAPSVPVTAALQGPPPGNMSCTLARKVFAAGSTADPLATASVALDDSGQGHVALPLPAGTYDVWAKETSHLARRINGWTYDPAHPATLDFGVLLAGDLVDDNVVNDPDFDYMVAKWYTDDERADINRDGYVNTVDFSFLTGNWGKTGD